MPSVLRPEGEGTRHAVPIAACGSLSAAEAREAFLRLPSMLQLRYIGVGVTEAGICHNGPSMVHLAQLLFSCFFDHQD